MEKRYTVAIVGATGAVGQEMLKLLYERKFPIKEIRCFASKSSVSKKLPFGSHLIPLEELKVDSFKEVDLALFSAGKTISNIFVPLALAQGAYVVDNSSAFRMDPSVPLVIPEINAHLIGSNKLFSCPNCIAAILLMALYPLHKHTPIKRVVASTYQAASGAGAIAMYELKEETRAYLDSLPFKRTVMPIPYAFNLFTHNASMTPSKYNEEELKIKEECQKILEIPTLKMAITCVRVPVLRAHSISLNVEFEHKLSAEQAKELLQQAPGVIVQEDWKNNQFPTPLDATGRDEVLVGRIRQDDSQSNTLDLWIVGDQLLKGAALNAIQIAEALSLIH
jgi:aspartate-semialdehyde dehydrogenase